MRKHSANQPYAKRSLGQNFLIDPNYIRKIIDAVDLRVEETIIEIGPGRGALTELLVESGANVLAIELDHRFALSLAERFGEFPNFQVLELDVLEAEFDELLKSCGAHAPASPVKLVANLPYYISTAILQKLAAQREVFTELVLMFQREVVERITALPGESARGYLTVIAEAAFEVGRLFDVPPAAFFPRPKVWSSVVRLSPKPPSALDNESFRELLKTAFTAKRKTIANNLRERFPRYTDALSLAGIEPSRRAETLHLEEWVRLAAAISS